MYQHTRRRFLTTTLTTSATVAGTSALVPELLAAQSVAASPASAPASGSAAVMSIAEWTGAQDPKDIPETEFAKIASRLTEEAIKALGGMGRFVKRGDVVWVKPNMAWDRSPETAANTNPQVVATLVRLCLDAGAKVVKVGDNTVNPAPKAYEKSGIADAARRAGAQVVFFDRSRVKKFAVKGERLKELLLFPEVVECDLVLNVPIVKHHSIATMTMCMKNYMGVMEERSKLHQQIDVCLADLTEFMLANSRLSVLDATRVLIAGGPSGGNLAHVRTPLKVAAGADNVALDAWGAEVAGRKPTEVRSIVTGEARGLGKANNRLQAIKAPVT